MYGPEDDANWEKYRRGEPLPPTWQQKLAGVGPGGTKPKPPPAKPDTALNPEEIEGKVTWIAMDAECMPDHMKICMLGESWESGEFKQPSEYDLKHLHINRLLDLREMLLTGAIFPVEG
jgi:hypothetical protein